MMAAYGRPAAQGEEQARPTASMLMACVARLGRRDRRTCEDMGARTWHACFAWPHSIVVLEGHRESLAVKVRQLCRPIALREGCGTRFLELPGSG
jgi:hypothetical protein